MGLRLAPPANDPGGQITWSIMRAATAGHSLSLVEIDAVGQPHRSGRLLECSAAACRWCVERAALERPRAARIRSCADGRSALSQARRRAPGVAGRHDACGVLDEYRSGGLGPDSRQLHLAVPGSMARRFSSWVGASAGPAGAAFVFVEYRVSFGHWMTAFQVPDETAIIGNPRRSNVLWWRRPTT